MDPLTALSICAHDNLCIYDHRSTHYTPDPDEPRKPRGDCSCDKCFYGKDAMALVMLRVLGEEP